MQQHPVPQNVSSYEFRLIGNMTIKQFLELGGGLGLAVFFYSTNLPDFIKWPFIIISALFGAALAFLPFDGRPLDRMVVIFIKTIYSPTQYMWKKTPILPEFFKFTPRKTKVLTQAELEKQKVRKDLGQYLDTLPKKPAISTIDQVENQSLYNIYSLFQTVPAATNITPSPKNTTQPVKKPSLKAHKLSAPAKPKPKKTTPSPSYTEIQLPPPTPLKPPTSKPTSPPPSPKKEVEVFAQPLPQPSSSTPRPPTNSTQTQKATHNQKLPFPSTPTTPNTLVGMVLSPEGKIIENAIIEVKDHTGLPVRALKSNKLGQFFSATQLPNGQYQIEVEKSGLKFAIVNLELKGDIVSPLEIKAQSPT